MRLIRNIAIYAAIAALCAISAILSFIFTLIANIVTCFISPIAIAAYATTITWMYSDEKAMSWEVKLQAVQMVFALPAVITVAKTADIAETLRTKLR